MALAKKVNTDNSVIMVVTGDGAIEEGSFYENLLFMKSNNLCVLIIVENNQWSLATSISERRCEIDLNHFCASMGIKYAKLSNNDVLEYRNQIQELRELSLKESSPICIEAECTTFGFRWTETETPPFKRLINYHHGEAFNKHLSELRDIPIMEETERDPLFVIKSKIGEEKLLTLSKEEYEKIFAEVGL
jgi:TPP-dependent pyruvate/acetoin dehydrogenase alpha subunit